MSLMEEARTGIPEVAKIVAEAEGTTPEKIARGLANGTIVIPINPIHNPRPVGIGKGTKVKVNVNIGTSEDCINIEEELEKARIAQKYGADSVMDLSTGGDIDEIRRKIVKEVNIPIGSVPIYQAGLEFARKSSIVNMTEDDIFNGIETHAKDGIDFMTVHCGVTKESISALKKADRLMGVVSRGGSFLTAWILHNGKENPLYENYDYLLELANEYEFTLSLGDGFRPGCIADATDGPQIQELIILGECVKRARKAGVQTMVEGPGHVPLNQIEANVRMQKTICKDAPFYVLGPLVTDIAPGYDHITGAIGGALAAYHGADFLCDVSPSEHLCLPTVEDIKVATITSKIAAHVADVARGGSMERDIAISKARKELDWDAQFKLCLDPELAKKRRKASTPGEEDVCTMCGEYCAIKITNEYLK